MMAVRLGLRTASRVAPIAHARAFSTTGARANDDALFLGFVRLRLRVCCILS